MKEGELDQEKITKAFSALAKEKFPVHQKAVAEEEEPSEPPFCKHPPTRLYAWWACGNDGSERTVLCVACRECGAVLQGRADAECEKYCP